MLKLGRAHWLAVLASAAIAESTSCAPSPNLPRDPHPYLIDIWESDDGLPQNSVISMIQTQDGYLWLGTLAGLVRFDGIRFTVFDEGNTPGLNSSRIVHLFEDSRTNLWIGTETSGVYLARNGQVMRLQIGAGNREGMLVSACEDATGAVWLYTLDGRLWRHHDGVSQKVLETSPTSLRTPAVIAEDSGLVWLSLEGSLVGIDSKGDMAGADLPVVHEMPVNRIEFLLASRNGGYWRLAEGRIQKWREDLMERDFGFFPWRTPVSSACEDANGDLIVGTQGEGVFWFDDQGEYTQLSASNGLSYSYILSLHFGRDGGLWVGTDGGGLNRVKSRIFQVVEPTLGWVVQSVAEDGEGGVWIASNGSGVGYLKNDQFRSYGPTNGLNNPNVRAIFVDREQRVWAGSSGSFGVGMHQFHQNRFIPFFTRQSYNRAILSLYQDRGGQMWVGTQGGLIRWSQEEWKLYTTDDGLSGQVVRAMVEDTQGRLWVGTDGGGLNRLEEARFTVWNKSNGFPSDNISSLHLDEDGVLWVGTYGSGLVRMNGSRITRFTTEDGLVSNTVGFLVEDEQGHLWIGSNAGLMRAPKSVLADFAEGNTGSIIGRVYGLPDGLPTRECSMGSQPGAMRSSDGRLWFPTIKGLVYVDPARLSRHAHPPSVAIETVLVDGEIRGSNRLNGGSPASLTVPAGRERLEIRFTALHLSAPDQARFKYRLQGHESAWAEAGGSRMVTYSKLPPGHFQFQLTASNEEGIWNETGAVLAITVLPPFWKTWWFMGMSAGGILAAIVLSVHYFSTQRLHRQLEFLRQQEALEKERSRIARDIHDQLGASLTQVNMLSEMIESDKDEPAEVEAHARQISQTAVDTSRALDEIVWTVNPSNDTLEGLINYLCKYAQDYLSVAGLRYRFDVPNQLPESVISPDLRHNVFLAAKEAITNVVRHARASEVWIRLRMANDSFTLEIEDNGKGLGALDEEAARRRHGLSNMRKRMEDVGGAFSLSGSEHGGARVRLTAPIGKT